MKTRFPNNVLFRLIDNYPNKRQTLPFLKPQMWNLQGFFINQLPLLIFFFCASISPKLTLAQASQVKIDSLQKLLKNKNSLLKKTRIYKALADEHLRQRDSSHTSQYVDLALKLARKQKNNQNIASIQFTLGRFHKRFSRDSLALATFREVIYHAQLAQDDNLKANAYNYIGDILDDQNKYHKALEAYQKALKLKQKVKDDFGIAANYNNLAIIYDKFGNHAKALDLYFKALKLWQAGKYEKQVASAANNIGMVYVDRKNFSEALIYFNKALEIKRKLKLPKGIAREYNHLGMTYKLMKDYPTALKYYHKALTIYKTTQDQYGIARVNHNLSAYYYKLKQYDKALKHARIGFKIREQLKSQYGIASSTMMIGKIHYGLKEYPKAIEHLENALKAFKAMKRLVKISATTRVLTWAYREQGNYQKAYTTLELFYEVGDSIMNQTNVKKITRMTEAFKFKKREDSLKLVYLHEKAIQNADYQIAKVWSYLCVMAVVGLLIGMRYLRIRQNNKYRQMNEALYIKETNETILQERLQRKEVEELILKEQLRMDQLEQEALRNNTESLDYELTKQTLYLIQKQQLIDQGVQELNAIMSIAKKDIKESLQQVTRVLTKGAEKLEVWDNFTTNFELAHPNFYKKLKEQHPTLTNYELRLCALMRLFFDTQELSDVLGISYESARKAKFRLRKKMGFASNEDIGHYIRNL